MPLWLRFVSATLDPFVGQTAKQAAVPALKLLLDPEFEHVSGAMFLCTRRFARILPRVYVTDPSHGARLWQLSENLTRIKNGAEAFPEYVIPEICSPATEASTSHTAIERAP
jgi:hypothetical protein